MLERPAAKPWWRPLRSAVSESVVRAGAKQTPAPSEPRNSATEHWPEGLGGGDPDHRAGADRDADHERGAATDPIRVAAGERGQARLQGGAGDEAAGDHDVSAAEFVDAQRHQHLDRAEHQRGHGDERRRGEDRAGGIVAATSRSGCRSGRRRLPACAPQSRRAARRSQHRAEDRPRSRLRPRPRPGSGRPGRRPPPCPARSRSPSRDAPAGRW